MSSRILLRGDKEMYLEKLPSLQRKGFPAYCCQGDRITRYSQINCRCLLSARHRCKELDEITLVNAAKYDKKREKEFFIKNKRLGFFLGGEGVAL